MYYNIELAYDPKVIGVKNGVYQLELDKKLYDSKTYELLDSFFISKEFSAKQEYPEFDFQFYFKKLKSAKKTSFMSFCPNLKHCQFLIRQDVLEIINRFNIQSFKDYPAIIYDSESENVDKTYKMFYSVLQDWDVVDFEKTIFTSGGFGNNPIIELKFSNENEIKSFNRITRLKSLALSKSFDSSLDLFQTRLGGNFVSERLKVALEENRLTGIMFSNEIQVII